MLHGYAPSLLSGTLLTLALALLSLAIAVVLGLAAASARLSRSRWLQGGALAYTTLIRGVPDLVLMLLVFFGGQLAVNALAPVGAVATEGATAVGGWNENDHVEPVEAMAEAALQLCWRPAATCSGEMARSIPLLQRLGVPVRMLDGSTLWKA